MKEEHNSAVGFDGGAGLNGRSASFTVPLRFFMALLSPVFAVATRGSPSLGLSGATVSLSVDTIRFASFYGGVIFVSQLSRPLSGDVVNWGWGPSKLKIHV